MALIDALTYEWRLHSQTVAPEVWAAVRNGAVAKKVTVANGVKVWHGALVIPAIAAASSSLAVRPKRVPDAPHMQWACQLPPGTRQSSYRHTSLHQEEHCTGHQYQPHHRSPVRDKSVQNMIKHGHFGQSY